MNAFIWAQIAGILGIAGGMALFHAKDMRGARKWKLTIDIIWSAHYILLGAYTGFATSIIAAGREIVFLNNDKKICQHKAWPWFFIFLNFVGAVITWKGLYSIFPALSSMVSTFIFWQKDIKRARYMGLGVNTMMFTYDVFAGSHMGMLTETISFVSTVVAIYRYREHKKEKN